MSTESEPGMAELTRPGFKSAIAKAVRDYMDTHDIRIKGLSITAEDIREGSLVFSQCLFGTDVPGANQGQVEQSEMTAAVDNFVRPALESWLNANKTAADQIIVGSFWRTGPLAIAKRQRKSKEKMPRRAV